MRDLYGRKINYLRISVTDLCNLRCKYCMPERGVSKICHSDMLTIEETIEIAQAFVDLGVDKIRLTGGEPLVKNGILDLVKEIGKLNIKDFAMTTNGLLLKKYAKDLKALGLNRVNISLDTLDSDKYSSITRGGRLEDVLDGIKAALENELVPIKINNVLMGGFNDNEIRDFVNWTRYEDIDVRFIELMPIGQALNMDKAAFIPNETVLDRVKDLYPVPRKDKSSPAKYYKLPNGKGRVGIINPISCKFCSDCNRVRLTSQGKLKLCLHSNEEIDLKTPLRNGQDIKMIIKRAILDKPESHQLEEGQYVEKGMNQIGG